MLLLHAWANKKINAQKSTKKLKYKRSYNNKRTHTATNGIPARQLKVA